MKVLETIENKLLYSVSERKWKLQETEESKVAEYIAKLGISSLVAKLLINKNVCLEDSLDFISPTLKNFLPNPFEIKDMKLGTERIIKAIKNNEKIAIYGDYDVDGATSSALFKRYFAMLGINVLVHIPDRVTEGYGPNLNALRSLKLKGVSLVITVDCGTAAIDVLNQISAEGLDIIVVDHHLGAGILPNVCAIINPNKTQNDSEYTYLAAVGVSFLVLVAINNLLRNDGYFILEKIEEPNLLSLLDIVALGTICDVVPLVGVNRAFVTQGLKIMSGWNRPGFTALAENAKIDQYPNTYHLGFLLGPRINAGGRVGKSDLGVRLLSTEDIIEAKEIAQKLEILNDERKSIEYMVLEQAIEQVENSEKNSNIIIVANNSWHQGVIGIAASRLKEKYNKPSVVISIENGIGKGSCRSVRGFNIGGFISEAKMQGIIIDGGGHAMAAGLSVKEDKIEELEDFLNRAYIEKIAHIDSFDTKYFENIVTVDYINLDVAEQIESLGPFGVGNEEPIFYITDVKIKKMDVFSEQHLRLFISGGEVVTGEYKMALGFRMVEEKIGQFLLSQKYQKIGLIGYIRTNSWRGINRANFIILDVVKE